MRDSSSGLGEPQKGSPSREAPGGEAGPASQARSRLSERVLLELFERKKEVSGYRGPEMYFAGRIDGYCLQHEISFADLMQIAESGGYEVDWITALEEEGRERAMSASRRYRTQPDVIEAMQWDPSTTSMQDVLSWLRDEGEVFKTVGRQLWIEFGDTRKSWMVAGPGDYVCRKTEGQRYFYVETETNFVKAREAVDG